MDGEFYAEGVLKVYSFSEKTMVYLRKINCNYREAANERYSEF